VAAAIPALWPAAGTTHRERPAISRGLVDRVVHVQRDSASVQVTRQWAGGWRRQPPGMRPVRTSTPRRDRETRLRRIRAWRPGGATTAPMATTLKRQGLRPPKGSRPFSQAPVGHLLDRHGVGDERRGPARLGPDEWELGALARMVPRPATPLREGVVRGGLQARQSPAQG
jgi:hypothetical protein